MNPLVTAVMLTTAPKRSAMVDQACLSFACQTYRPMELVVVNDGSLLMPLHPAVRVVQVPPGTSIGAKRNAGVQAAYGEYVACWDDDDFSLPERIATHVQELLASGARYHKSSTMWVADQDLKILGLLVHHASYGTSLVHRGTLLEVGGYPDISYLEDMEVFVRFALRGIKRSASEHTVYVHRRHGTNVSSAHSSQSLDVHVRQADRSNPAAITHANGRMAALMALPHQPLLRSSQ